MRQETMMEVEELGPTSGHNLHFVQAVLLGILPTNRSQGCLTATPPSCTGKYAAARRGLELSYGEEKMWVEKKPLPLCSGRRRYARATAAGCIRVLAPTRGPPPSSRHVRTPCSGRRRLLAPPRATPGHRRLLAPVPAPRQAASRRPRRRCFALSSRHGCGRAALGRCGGLASAAARGERRKRRSRAD
jgi:hypothetical protein